MEYGELKSEAPLESESTHRPPVDWPAHGVVSAEQASFKYSPDGPTVLKQLSFCIKAQEKVALVVASNTGGF